MKKLTLLLFTPIFLFSSKNGSASDLSYYSKGNSLFITNPFDHRTYVIPDISTKIPAVIHMKGDISKIDSVKLADKAMQNKDGKKSDSIDRNLISKYILECQNYYEDGRFKEAWDVLELAEEINNNDYRIKKMKGSLLIEMGDEEAGLSLWRESLKINPNQTDLKLKLKNLNRENE